MFAFGSHWTASELQPLGDEMTNGDNVYPTVNWGRPSPILSLGAQAACNNTTRSGHLWGNDRVFDGKLHAMQHGIKRKNGLMHEQQDSLATPNPNARIARDWFVEAAVARPAKCRHCVFGLHETLCSTCRSWCVLHVVCIAPLFKWGLVAGIRWRVLLGLLFCVEYVSPES